MIELDCKGNHKRVDIRIKILEDHTEVTCVCLDCGQILYTNIIDKDKNK